MPATRGRRAAAATPVPPANPLAAYRFAFSGKFPGYSHKELTSLFTSLGAAVTSAVSARNTHLVCDEKDFVKKAPKVRDAEAAGVSLVNAEWIDQVATLKTDLDPNNHLWPAKDDGEADDASNSKAAASDKTKKRPIAVANPTDTNEDAGVDADSGAKPKAKKARGKAVKAKTRVAADGDTKDAVKEETIESKLQGLSNGQFLKKKDIVIPIDEHCPLQNYFVYVEPGSGMIYDASLNQSSTSNNHNKFYRLQVRHSLPFSCQNKTDCCHRSWLAVRITKLGHDGAASAKWDSMPFSDSGP